MKINKNSWHSKLYHWTYDTDYITYLPTNLCPYFWKLVFALLVFIPNLIVRIPYLILNKLWFKEISKGSESTINGILCSLSIFLLFVVSIMEWELIKACFNFYSYDSFLANSTLMMDLLVLIILSIFIYNITINKNYIKDGVNIPVEFIKAKYNKYCPQITWLD